MARQNLKDERSGRTGGKLTEGFEQGIVRFFAAKAFQALSTSDANGLAAGERALEGVRDGGLSDTRFSGNEDYLAAAFENFLEAGIEFRHGTFAAHRDRRRGGGRGKGDVG